MIQVTFSDGKIYQVQSNEFGLENAEFHYADTGDRHGNNNIRSDYNKLSVEDVILKIKPEILPKTIAAFLDNQLVGLDTKIVRDCCLKPIQLSEKQGKMVAYHTLSVLLAQCIFELAPKADLLDIQYRTDECILVYEKLDLDEITLAEGMKQRYALNKSVSYRDIWPKDMLISSFPSLCQTFNQKKIKDYDEYENIPVAVYDDFSVIVPENTVFAVHVSALPPIDLKLEKYDMHYEVIFQLDLKTMTKFF